MKRLIILVSLLINMQTVDAYQIIHQHSENNGETLLSLLDSTNDYFYTNLNNIGAFEYGLTSRKQWQIENYRLCNKQKPIINNNATLKTCTRYFLNVIDGDSHQKLMSFAVPFPVQQDGSHEVARIDKVTVGNSFFNSHRFVVYDGVNDKIYLLNRRGRLLASFNENDQVMQIGADFKKMIPAGDKNQDSVPDFLVPIYNSFSSSYGYAILDGDNLGIITTNFPQDLSQPLFSDRKMSAIGDIKKFNYPDHLIILPYRVQSDEPSYRYNRFAIIDLILGSTTFVDTELAVDGIQTLQFQLQSFGAEIIARGSLAGTQTKVTKVYSVLGTVINTYIDGTIATGKIINDMDHDGNADLQVIDYSGWTPRRIIYAGPDFTQIIHSSTLYNIPVGTVSQDFNGDGRPDYYFKTNNTSPYINLFEIPIF